MYNAIVIIIRVLTVRITLKIKILDNIFYVFKFMLHLQEYIVVIIITARNERLIKAVIATFFVL